MTTVLVLILPGIVGFCVGWFLNLSWGWLVFALLASPFVFFFALILLEKTGIITLLQLGPPGMEYSILMLLGANVGMVAAVVIRRIPFVTTSIERYSKQQGVSGMCAWWFIFLIGLFVMYAICRRKS